MSASSHPAPKRVVVRLPIDPTLTALSEHRVFVDARRVTSVQLGELAALPDLQFLELSGPAIDLSIVITRLRNDLAHGSRGQDTTRSRQRENVRHPARPASPFC